jgi:hypothetical protein
MLGYRCSTHTFPPLELPRLGVYDDRVEAWARTGRVEGEWWTAAARQRAKHPDRDCVAHGSTRRRLAARRSSGDGTSLCRHLFDAQLRDERPVFDEISVNPAADGVASSVSWVDYALVASGHRSSSDSRSTTNCFKSR